MKIKVTERSFDEVMAMEKEPHVKPVKQSGFFRWLLKTLSKGELKATHFTCTHIGMDKIQPGEPVLFLMNHSSFTDLQIAATLLKDRQYHIIMTNDGMVGKAGLMRRIGCVATRKFITDLPLVRDMIYCIKELNSSILLYPEASYTFDGTETPLPDSLGKCIKLMKVPVVMIRTHGAFLRDPLYNNLQKRKVNVTAEETCILTKEDVKRKSAEEINEILKANFSYDHFAEQIEQQIPVTEPFRADGLERVLYRCPACGKEGTMTGKGITIRCSACGEEHVLSEIGKLERTDGAARFETVPQWYAWERQCVRDEIEAGTYRMETDVEIMMLKGTKSMYKVGEGHLVHDSEGFHLTGCDGKIDFRVAASTIYSLYADYFWYEIGDVIAIGDSDFQYYCFPKQPVPVAKARLATEEMYKKLN